jgi:hypothetical protein
MSTADPGLPIEQFIQALQTQLDKAQSAMALKAENLDLPLTFAVKDISIDLRTHVDVVKREVRIRPAGPGEREASTLRLSLTTITRPMIAENARAPEVRAEDQSLDEAVGEELDEDDRKQLEWVGVHTVSQLRRIKEQPGGVRALERVSALPVDRLRRALARASQPYVERIEPHEPEPDARPDLPTLLRVRGRNLTQGRAPRVSVEGEPVSVLKATDRELVLAPHARQMAGVLTIQTGTDDRVDTAFDLSSYAKSPRGVPPATAPESEEDEP